MELLLIFIVLNIINVILQTAKSIITIKCGTSAAATANAVAYGLYTIVLVYMSCELSLLLKVLIVALTNFIGVYIVKFFEKKLNKDKLWKYEINVPCSIDYKKVIEEMGKVPYNTISLGNETILNIYSYNQETSKKVTKTVKDYNLKYFVTESKITL